MADAYIYQAALLCADCGSHVVKELTAEGLAPANPQDESSYDSGAFPKGPYPNGGGEADSPQHCDHCGTFLENPLTGDGESYVRHAVTELEQVGKGDPEVVAEWKSFYDYLFPDPED